MKLSVWLAVKHVFNDHFDTYIWQTILYANVVCYNYSLNSLITAFTPSMRTLSCNFVINIMNSNQIYLGSFCHFDD